MPSTQTPLLHKLYIGAVALVVALLTFSGVALAADIVDPSDGSADLAHTLYAAITAGHYALAASGALVLLVAAARRWINAAWMHTDAGSAALVLLGSFGGALMTSLAGGGPLTAHLAYAAFGVAFMAAGGYQALKKLVVEPLAPRLPAWVVAVLNVVFALAPVGTTPVSAGNPAPAPTPAPVPTSPPAPKATGFQPPPSDN